VALSETNVRAQDRDNISTDPHINHSVISVRGPDKNPARALHFDSLFNQHAFPGLSDAMRDHPGGCDPAAEPVAGSSPS
jgi:hypothetical protein